MKKYMRMLVTMMKKQMHYLKGLIFSLIHRNEKVFIKREFKKSRAAIYGYVTGFNLNTGEVQINVFDYGLWYKDYYDYSMLEMIDR